MFALFWDKGNSVFNNLSLTRILWSISTCYYVLGLIAKTQQGVDVLGELGWEGVVTPNGVVEGICVPIHLKLFLSVSIRF